MPNIRHQELSVRLVVALANFLEPNPVAVVFHAPLDCVFSFFDVVEPDVLVVTNDQREILTKRNVRGAPALVIEILSPDSSPRDKPSKRALYERAGVREYWVVDPASDCISVYRLEKPGRFRFPQTLTAEGVHLTTLLLPGFSLDLAKFFR